MPRTYSYVVDDETAVMIDQDLSRMARELGHKLSVSQYHRLVMADKMARAGLMKRSGLEIGYSEGYLAAYSDVMRAVQTAVNGLKP